MLRSRITGLLICVTGSALLVTCLYFLSGWMASHPNGFLRKLPPHQIKGLGYVRLPNSYYYISGNDQTTIYLGNKLHRANLLVVHVPGKDTLTKRITGYDTVKLSSGLYLKADSANVYLLDAGKPAILSGNIGDSHLTRLYQTPRFTGALPLSNSITVFKIIEQGRKAALVKFTDHKSSLPHFLDEQGDGIFSTDGMLIKGSANRIFYVYYYRNQFACLDTALHLLFKGKTIDTNNHVQIKIGRIASEHQFTLASPPAFVNKHCATNNRYLFVQSALKADNELNDEMNEAAVVDVYNVSNGQYLLSFYVGDFDHEKMRDFRICGNTLVALFDHYIYLYQLYF
jgi:hypothetical protein